MQHAGCKGQCLLKCNSKAKHFDQADLVGIVKPANSTHFPVSGSISLFAGAIPVSTSDNLTFESFVDPSPV